MSTWEMCEGKWRNMLELFAVDLAEAGFSKAEMDLVTWANAATALVMARPFIEHLVDESNEELVFQLLLASDVPHKHELHQRWQELPAEKKDKAWRYAQFFLKALQ